MARKPRKIGARWALCAVLAAVVGLGACTHSQPFRQPAQHQVRPGETLGWIARGYGVNPQHLARANGLDDGDRLTVGRRLRIPDGGRITHRVRPGETLSQIAQRYRVPVSTIASTNRLGRFGKIQAGAWLILPREATLPLPPPALIAREAVPALLAKPPVPRVAAVAPAAPPAADPARKRAEALVDEAVEHYRAARFELALKSARDAEALLAEHADAREARSLGARAAFVAGSAHAGLGERDRAVGSFARVRALDPLFEPPRGWLSPRLEALYLEAKTD